MLGQDSDTAIAITLLTQNSAVEIFDANQRTKLSSPATKVDGAVFVAAVLQPHRYQFSEQLLIPFHFRFSIQRKIYFQQIQSARTNSNPNYFLSVVIGVLLMLSSKKSSNTPETQFITTDNKNQNISYVDFKVPNSPFNMEEQREHMAFLPNDDNPILPKFLRELESLWSQTFCSWEPLNHKE